MPDVSRTQVTIETSIDAKEANKKIDDLEKKLDKLEEPKTINLDFDKATEFLKNELAAVNQKVAQLFKGAKGGINNINGMGEQIERKSSLQSALAELKKLGPSITSDKLQDILSSVGYQLDGDTISAIGATMTNDNTGITEIKDAALDMQRTLQEYNSLISATRNKQNPLKPADLEKTNSKIEELKGALLKMGVTEKSFNPNGYASYKNAWKEYSDNKKEKEEKKDSGQLGKLAGAIIGIQSVFAFVRKIAAQNDKITVAVDRLTSSLAQMLSPILDFLAAIINTIAGWFGKIFGVNEKTSQSTGSMARSLAGFDEINNLSGPSGGGTGSSSTPQIDILDWLEDLLSGIVDIIKGIIETIIGLFGLIVGAVTLTIDSIIGAIVAIGGMVVGTITGFITGMIDSIIALISGIWTTVTDLISDLVNVVTSVFGDFKKGFKDAIDEGNSLIIAILKGLWEAFKGLIKNIIDLVVNYINNLWNTIKNVFTAFVEGFKKGFKAVWDFVYSNFLQPLMNSMHDVYTKILKPAVDFISRGVSSIWNGAKSAVRGFAGMINSVISVINKIPGVNIGYLPTFATGGFPQRGELFLANEAGPEMVGKIGSQNAVVNNDQIIEGIKQGVLEAMSSSSGNQNISLYIDGKQVTDVVVKNIRQQSRLTGMKLV